MKERSLILFTILSQMAVGAFLVSGLLSWQWSFWVRIASTSRLVDGVLLLVGILILLSLLASLFHLGSPSNAWRVLANLRRSWLSREVLFALLFACTGALFTFLRWFSLGSSPQRIVLALLAASFGLALIYSMARVYMLPTAPVWNSWLTMASFFVTALLLGSLAVGAALAVFSIYLPWDQAFAVLPGLRRIGALLLLVFLLQFILIPLQITRLVSEGSPRVRRKPLSRVYLYRIMPLFLGTALAGVLFFSSNPLNGPAALGAILALGLVLLAELFGRSLFYASYDPRM